MKYSYEIFIANEIQCMKPVLSGHAWGMLQCPLNTGCPPNTGFDVDNII